MASVVVCPHCCLQLSVPADFSDDARVKCPACRSAFDLEQGEPRSLPELLRAEPLSLPASSQSESPNERPTPLGPTFDLPDVPLTKAIAATVDLPGESPFGSTAGRDFELEDVKLDHQPSLLGARRTNSGGADKTVDFVAPTSGPAETPRDHAVSRAVLSTVGGRRRSRSLRKIAGLVATGVCAMGLVYYVMLYFLGPRGDVLHAVRFLPSAALPDSFRASPIDVAQATDAPPRRANIVDQPAAGPLDSNRATEVVDRAPHAPARFEQPIELRTAPSTTKRRYGAVQRSRDAQSTSTYGARPARFEQPTTAASAAETISAFGLIDQPSVTTHELAAALDEAKAALAGLVEGDLDEPSRRRAKGLSYAKLCDLAQVLTFGGDHSSDDTGPLEREAESLFREALADTRTRGEVARIAVVWIDSPHRQHDGVFVAGQAGSGRIAGEVYEYRLELAQGESLVILSPRPIVARSDTSTTPVGIVGTIVDHPAQAISGYAGDARQAIWVGRTIRLD